MTELSDFKRLEHDPAIAWRDAEIHRLRSELHSIRDSTIEDCARVAAISASASEAYGDDIAAFVGREIETGILLLKDSTPREE